MTSSDPEGFAYTYTGVYVRPGIWRILQGGQVASYKTRNVTAPKPNHLGAHQPQLGPQVPDHRPDTGLGHHSPLLLDQPLPDPPSRVPLLPRRLPVGDQPRPDRRYVHAEHRRHPIRALTRWRHRRGKRTVRRCTLCRTANARIHSPSSRCSRRIRSNCSTLDLPITPTPFVIALADVTERRGRSGRGWGHFKPGRFQRTSQHRASGGGCDGAGST